MIIFKKLSENFLYICFFFAVSFFFYNVALGQDQDIEEMDEYDSEFERDEALMLDTQLATKPPGGGQNPSIAIRTGVASVDDSDYDASWEYGAEIGFRPFTHYSYAFDISGFTANLDNGLPSLTRTRLLAKNFYNVAGSTPFIRHTYLGAGIGPVWDNQDNDITTELGIAPTVGFDIPLEDQDQGLNLGANANYLFVSGDRPDAFTVAANLKYKF